MKTARKFYNYLGAAVTTGFITGFSQAAQANTQTQTNNFNKITGNIQKSISDFPGMISGISYLLGLLLLVLGILKIKDHVENPTQTALKDGAIRVVAGGALFAVPMMSEAAFNTIGQGDAVSAAKLNKVQFSVK